MGVQCTACTYLLVRLNDAIRCRFGRARQDPPISFLVFTQEATVSCIDRARDNLAGARRARAGTASIRQLGVVIGIVELIEEVEKVHIRFGVILDTAHMHARQRETWFKGDVECRRRGSSTV